MTAEEFRQLALEFEGSTEGSHMGHADFRVNKKIFATLNHDETLGMVKLTPEQQEVFIGKSPKVFFPCAGAWGKGGATYVNLEKVKVKDVSQALELAWRNTVKKK